MDNRTAMAFYEKLYFHELENREKLTPRLHLSLAILTTILAALVYIGLRVSFSKGPGPAAAAIFLVSIVVATVLVSASVLDFVKALWGHTYECVPTATKIEEYRQVLLAHYAGMNDGNSTANEHFAAFLLRYFSECAAANATVNEVRYRLLHGSLSLLVYALPFLVAAGAVFAYGGISSKCPI